MAIKKTQIEVLNSNIKKKISTIKASVDAILSSGKQIIVSLGH